MTQSIVRKTAVSLIYALMEQKATSLDSFPLDAFWAIELEKETHGLEDARTRAVLHILRNAQDIAAPVLTRGAQLPPSAQTDAALTQTLNSTTALLNHLHLLSRASKDPLRLAAREPQQLARRLLREAARLLSQIRELFLHNILDRQPYAAPFTASLRRWKQLLEHCVLLEHPADMVGQDEFSGLVNRARFLEVLPPHAQKLADAAYSRREEWDELLRKTMRKYDPARLDVIVKAILYLMLYELRYNKLEPAIVISEANNLANEFAGSKSAPFIHGVLGTIALECEAPPAERQ